jgi:type II secretory pathway predicted ATPase ExeA
MTSLADLTRGPERVFPTHARVERYYPAAGAEEARAVLRRCIERGEGPALLIGSPGTGKSMLLQVVAHDVASQRSVACLTSAQLCTRRALLQSILFELDQPFRQRDEGELRLELIDYLKSANVGGRGVVLLVDEAQSLPTRLLEELRVLSNLSHNGEPRLHLILAGSQALDEKFTSPEIEVFNQRIAARCYLSPFNHHDTAQYVRGHLAAAGANPDELFTADALNAVYEATGGIARLINQLCDRALLVATRRQALRVNRDLVQGAWADLQQLPTPWNLPDTPEGLQEQAKPVSVEYGPLGSEPRDSETDFEGTELDESYDALDLAADNFGIHDDEPTLRPSFPSARVFDPSDDGEDLELLDEEESVAQEPADPWGTKTVSGFGPREEQFSFPTEPKVTNTSNPFDETFEDEEIVIDPFANLSAVVSPGGGPVTNPFEKEISGLLHQVARYEGTVDCSDTPQSLGQGKAQGALPASQPESDLANSFTIVEAFEGLHGGRSRETKSVGSLRDIRSKTKSPSFGGSSPATEEDSDVERAEQATQVAPELLVVDDDASLGENPSIAFPTDYRQLFASLRRD